MKGTIIALAVGSALSTVNALTLVKRDNPAVFSLPFERRAVPAESRRRRSVKRGTVNVNLQQIDLTAYYATVKIGTPAQTVVLDVDTGSSDMWVLSPNAAICANSGCSANGVYDRTKSSTAQILADTFSDSYGDGSVAKGPYVNDTIQVGGATLKNFEFGVATSYNTQAGSSNTLSGLLGIGYPALEGASEAYPNLPIALANADLINTPAYSLWLNDINASGGQILFGGVNRAKYHGNLAVLDLLVPQSTQEPTAFYVSLTGISVTNNNSNTKGRTRAIPALLDSGSQYTTLAQSDVEFIVTQFNGSFDVRTGSLVAPCSLQSSKATIDFAFGGQTINVPVAQMLVGPDVDPRNNRPLADSNNNALCMVGLSVADSSDPTLILGDTFLRSAYVVYDLFNAQVAIANTNFNSTTDDIVEITGDGKNPDVIPGVTTLTSARASATISTASRVGPDRATSVGAVTGIPTITATYATGTATATGSKSKNAASTVHGSFSIAPILLAAVGMVFGSGLFMYI